MALKKLNLTKEMYGEAKKQGLSFAQFLQTQDDQEHSKLDAYERQLQAHNLRIRGKQVSLVEDFYKTASNSVLFPEFINREVLAGMDIGRNECMLTDLVANVRTIDSNVYQGLTASAKAGEKGAFRVGEGGTFPKTIITLANKPVTLIKFGHAISIPYEVSRRIAVDALAVHLRLIGRYLRRSMVAEGIDIIINGDGNSNGAAVDTVSGLNYNNIIDFDSNFDDDGFSPTLWLTTKIGMNTILKMSEFKDPQAGFNYQQTGKMISPLGVTLRKSSAVPASRLIGVDRTAALEQLIEAGSQLTEADKIIDKQLDEVVISQNGGFSKIYTAAARVWNWT